MKKGGIFPIVHGVRSLAIEQGLMETNTFARLDALAERKLLKEDFARGWRRRWTICSRCGSTRSLPPPTPPICSSPAR